MFKNLKDSVRSFSKKTKETVAEKELSEEKVEDVLWDLEMSLLENNVAADVIEQIKADMKDDLIGTSVTRMQGGQFIKESLSDALIDVLDQDQIDLDNVIAENDPALIVFMGFNGAGKTTTIAKLASQLKGDHEVVLAAGDTFRSAAIDQLQEHGENLGLKVIAHEYGSDPAAVIFDAVKHAEKEDKDVVLADTSGRSHSDRNLMDELKKLCDVNDPTLKILVVDALAGNDLLEQAKSYEEVGFDGIVLTKVDVDKKGGAALSLGYVTGHPIMYLCTGQDYEDIEPFDAQTLVDQWLE